MNKNNVLYFPGCGGESREEIVLNTPEVIFLVDGIDALLRDSGLHPEMRNSIYLTINSLKNIIGQLLEVIGVTEDEVDRFCQNYKTPRGIFQITGCLNARIRSLKMSELLFHEFPLQDNKDTYIKNAIKVKVLLEALKCELGL